MADQALRKPALAGRHGGSAGARVTPAAPATRLSLRAGEDALGTLSLAFGERFTPELRNAWLTADGAISGVMIAAAQQAPKPQAAAE